MFLSGRCLLVLRRRERPRYALGLQGEKRSEGREGAGESAQHHEPGTPDCELGVAKQLDEAVDELKVGCGKGPLLRFKSGLHLPPFLSRAGSLVMVGLTGMYFTNR